MRQLQLLVCAVQFLTRLPTPALADFEPEWISRSAPYFPLVGQFVGLISAAAWLAVSHIWPGWPAALLAIGASVLITGGFHEDGLADTADGLGGGQTRERRLEIMKDSRLGGYGALALILGLGLRAALLAGMTRGQGALALIAAHGGARAAAVAVMAALPYGGDPAAAKVKPSPAGVRWPEAGLALALGVWPFALMDVRRALIALGLAAATTLAMALLSRRLIGGVTGDVLGAVEQLAEVALLAGAAAGLPA